MNIQEHIEEVKKALEYFSDYDPEAADNVVVDDGLVHLAAIDKMTGATPTDEDLMKERAKVAKLEKVNNRLISAANYMLDTLDTIQFRDAANMRLHAEHPAYEKLQQSLDATKED